MLPAIFFGVSLAIALNVQMMSSPLAGAWVLFLVADCVTMLHRSHDKDRGIVWWSCLAWACILGLSAFIFAPIMNGAAVMWIFLAMPAVALSMRKEFLQNHLNAALAVLTVYAVGLIVQLALHVEYTNINYLSNWMIPSVAWPLLDPNNAAAVVNIGLIPCLYMALRKPRWWALVGIFSFALFATASKTGCIIAALAGVALMTEFYRIDIPIVLIVMVSALWAALETFGHWIVNSAFQYRIPMWADSIQLLWIRPFNGLGFGSFADYYARVRTEHSTAGFFAHNDVLQIAIEAGIPAAIIFLAVFAAIYATTGRRNFVSGMTVFSVFLHSMMEFQFYIPAITLLMGLAIAYHRCNTDHRGL